MAIKRNILLQPGPATTTDTVKQALAVSDIYHRDPRFSALVRQIQRKLIDAVHGGEAYTSVLFCGSGTICMDIALNSLLPEGKKVLAVNNGLYGSRAVDICKAYGLPHIDLQLPATEAVDVCAVERALTKNSDIGVVYATHHETFYGVLNPMKELGELVNRHDAVFIVDTTSSYGMIPLDVNECHINFCMSSSQKGLAAMAGIAFLIGRKDLIERSKNYPVRSYYCNLYRQYEYFERTGEMHFTPPVQLFYALDEALRAYEREGETPKYERIKRMNKRLHRLMAEMGMKELIPDASQSPLIVLADAPDWPGWDMQKVLDVCAEEGYSISTARMNGRLVFRFCAFGAIDEEDIDRFASMFKRVNKPYMPN